MKSTDYGNIKFFGILLKNYLLIQLNFTNGFVGNKIIYAIKSFTNNNEFIVKYLKNNLK